MTDILTMIIAFAVFGVAAYLLGSVNFAIITTKFFTGSDVRDSGSGNAGMTNVMRTAGFLPGVITFVGDFLKAVVAVSLGKYAIVWLMELMLPQMVLERTITDMAPWLCAAITGFFCMLGHVYPVFFGYKGGKGIVTAAGTMLVLDWRILAIELAIFLILFIATRIISVGSIVAAICYPVIAFIALYFWVDAGAMPVDSLYYIIAIITATALLVIIKHKANIIRLLHKEEPQLVLKKHK